MSVRPRLGWLAFLRVLIVFLLVILAAAVYISQNTAVVRRLLLALPINGVVEIPDFGPPPPLPAIDVPRGLAPNGQMALWGETKIGPFGCGFLMRLPDGRRLGVSSGHSTQLLPASLPGRFTNPDGTLAVNLAGQLRIGSPFMREQFSLDYAFWSLKDATAEEDFLTPDPRGAPLPGERVWLYTLSSGRGGAGRRAGVVMLIKPEAIWVRLDEGFDPHGSSGCPVVSQHTGQLVGMVVAGENLPPVVMGLHPVGSLLEKAQAALP